MLTAVVPPRRPYIVRGNWTTAQDSAVVTRHIIRYGSRSGHPDKGLLMIGAPASDDRLTIANARCHCEFYPHHAVVRLVNSQELIVKTIVGLFAAAALVGLATSAASQPPGSYRDSCRDVRMQGSVLTALCRRAGGRGEQLTALNVANCVGDIGNNNGNLVCNGGQPARPVSPPPQQDIRVTPRRDTTAHSLARDIHPDWVTTVVRAGHSCWPAAGPIVLAEDLAGSEA